MPVLEFAPPAPASPHSKPKSPLSPSRVSSNNSPRTATAAGPLKPALKSPKAGSKRLPDENGVRFEGSSSPNVWQGAREDVERAAEDEQGLSQHSQQSLGEDVSMDLQSEDGGITEEQERTEMRGLRGEGGIGLNNSTSTSSIASSSARERVPLHSPYSSLLHRAPAKLTPKQIPRS